MKKSLIGIMFLIIAIMLLCSCSGYRTPVADSIEKHLDKSEHGVKTGIRIADFTSFEWDKVLVFNYPTSTKEINTALGVEYTGSTDLTNGMIFVKDGEIVHYEYFEQDYSFETPGEFMIYPQTDINATPKYRVFLSEDAIFSGEKCYTESNYLYYRLYPVS